MAAGGFKEFVAGEVLDEDEINDFLMQGMLVFAGTAARGSAITSPVEGQFSFLTDTDTVEFYDGAQWTALSASLVEASGGTITTGNNPFTTHTFNSSGTFTVTKGGKVEYLIVAGGGSGGQDQAGGGGAGGVITGTFDVTPQAYTIVVGAGGAAKTTGGSGNAGSNSSAFGFTAIGGGFGGGTGAVGGSGGSGGGGGGGQAGGAGTSGQGNNGGSGASTDGGGGGGFSTVGQNRSGGVANGGDGIFLFNKLLANGGGGSGGRGFGGSNVRSGTNEFTASNPDFQRDAPANSGGGGGGTRSGGQTSGAGGSGVVIIRYVREF